MKILKYAAIIAVSCAAIAAVPSQPTPRIEFDAWNTYPEGVAYDQARDVFYVSSARLGSIGKVSPNGSYSLLFQDSTLKSTYGMKVHPDGKRLFVCAGDANYSQYPTAATRMKMARLISIDLSTGKKVSDLDLSQLLPGKHFPNDLTFDAQGNSYITDSFAGAIYKVTPDGRASVFAKDNLFKMEGIGLNGIVYHPEGYLIADASGTGQLYKIDLKNPKNVQKVSIDQYFLGADGLLLTDPQTLTLVVNGGTDKIYQLKSTDNWKTAKVVASTLTNDRFTYPSTATQNGKTIWVMNAQFNQLLDSNAVPVKRFALQQVVYRPVK